MKKKGHRLFIFIACIIFVSLCTAVFTYRVSGNESRNRIQLDLKETLDNFSRDYAKVIGLNAKLFNETIALKNEIDKLKAANKELRSELSKGKDMGHGNSLHM